MQTIELLSEPLSDDPIRLFGAWFEDARARALQPNPDAMVLATVGLDGHPAARIVLCKQLSMSDGYVVFFTNYRSRKGRELAAHPRAAAVFHWDALHRQVRIEGPVVRSPKNESDSYFASRPLVSRIGAWASQQSEPLESRTALAESVREVGARFGIAPTATQAEVPRPPHWGGHRLWIDSIELWVEGAGRVHDRAEWKRSLIPRDEYGFSASPWQGTWLYP